MATFPNRLLNNAADGYQVTASAAGITDGLSNTFNVTFTTLAVQPVANMQAGTLFNVVVEARDANGVAAENFGAASALALTNLQAAVPANGQMAFNGAVAPTFGAGSGTFTGMAINNAANGYTFAAQATSGGVPVVDAINAGFNVTATHLAVLAVANVESGAAFNVTAQARDANNNVAENFTRQRRPERRGDGRVELHRRPKDELGRGRGGRRSPTRSWTRRPNGYPVTASAAGDHRGHQQRVQRDVLDAGGAAGGEHAGRDAVQRGGGGAGRKRGAGRELRRGERAGADQPAGGGAGQRADGVQRGGRADVWRRAGHVHGAGDQQRGQRLYVLGAGDLEWRPQSSDAINAGFNVTATHLAVTTAMAGHTVGTPFNVTAQARDANNNLAENFTSNVNLNAAAVGGSNFNGGQQTVAAVGGVAAFANLVLNDAANGYTVTASAAGLTSGISNAFNVTGDGDDSDAESLEFQLSQSVVGAGSTITITAIVRNRLSDPIRPLPDITYKILFDEGSSGSPPAVVAGQILTSSDTRGGFVLHGTVDGTTVTGDVIFAVTPSAAQSANAGKFAALALAEGTVALKLDELTDAFESGNMGAIPAINAALQAARNSIVVTGRTRFSAPGRWRRKPGSCRRWASSTRPASPKRPTTSPSVCSFRRSWRR